MNQALNPGHILGTATAFWNAKVLLTAVEFDLFSVLGDRAMTAAELGNALGLHPRGIYDFFDALVALGFLERDGDGSTGQYRNTPETKAFLDRKSPMYIGGLPAMFNARLYSSWHHLGTALKTGEPQSAEAKAGNPKALFDNLYSDKDQLAQFLEAMSGAQAGNFQALAQTFDFSKYSTMCDVGGALALLSRVVAAQHPHLKLTSFDLPPVVPLARKKVEEDGLSDRVAIAEGDFFQDDLPSADIITMGNILHDWNLEIKKQLIRKVYAALPANGVFIVIENIIDDARRKNAFGLLMSLNMLIEVGDGFDYTGADFREWCSEAGFQRFEILPLTGPSSAAIAYK